MPGEDDTRRPDEAAPRAPLRRPPMLAIVGRPNVGKSTLFNRLVGKKLALVDDQPGVTRDRREGEADLIGLKFRVMDTAGYEDLDAETLPGRMRMQTEAAVAGADTAMFMIDARVGVTPLDEEIARWLRASDTPVILVANKAEGKAGDAGINEAYALGLGEPVALGADVAVFDLSRDADHCPPVDPRILPPRGIGGVRH